MTTPADRRPLQESDPPGSIVYRQTPAMGILHGVLLAVNDTWAWVLWDDWVEPVTVHKGFIQVNIHN